MSGARSKRKGDQFERDVRDFLRRHWPFMERRRNEGTRDRGDLIGLPGWVVECKNHQSIDLAGFMAQAEREAVTAKVPHFVAVVKRRGKNAAHAYAVMPLWLWADLVKQAEAVKEESHG